ncbi:MAG: DNA-processing protein DprA [Proteobacteria bacterium]|nr:DNA-processing protein DprA [Pseudomonadota bacterium]
MDLALAAHRVGGFSELQRGGLAALLELGLKPERARRWLETPAVEVPWSVLTLADPRYPRALAAVPSAPAVLEVDGDVEALQAPAVAVVGTRNSTSYGTAVARHLGQALAKAGVTVVSGLARGIDGQAHWGAALAGRTAAVVAHGLEHTAPARHKRLRQEIVARGGAIVSALPSATEPRPWQFPIRNQWVAGLVEAVVVVEAPLKSGALITATRAAELARDVVVVPGRLGDPASRGCLRLLAEGAEPLEDVDEWVAARFSTSRPQRERWLELLFEGHTVGEVARVVGRSGASLLADLSMRELSGEVVRLPGQRYGPGGRA